MAPRLAFSKFRTVECKCLPREQNFDQLQVSIDNNVLAASSSHFAFIHQSNNGGVIQLKSLTETGHKSITNIPTLVHAHPTGCVTALTFSSFHKDLLLSAGDATATLKLWKVPSNEPMTQDLVTPVTVLQHEKTMGFIAGIVPHPTAEAVVATYSRPGTVRIYDLQAETLSFGVKMEQSTALSSVAWNWDGSAMLVATQDQAVRFLDPRLEQTSTPLIRAAHTGKRHLNVVWCGRMQQFVTCGSDRMQEREIKLWDPRQLAKCVHRERLDSGGVGKLFPLYDADLNLLYVLGKGDYSAKMFEVRARNGLSTLDHTILSNMTLAATLLPKSTCDTNVCEIARVLNLSANGSSVGGTCEVLSYRMPRKEATHTFQSDLYPDTLATQAAITPQEWQQGQNAEPKLKAVIPSVKRVEKMSGSVFGRPTASASTAFGWGAPALNAGTATNGWQASGWGQALSSTASSGTPSKTATGLKTGWGSNTRKWNEPEPKAQTASAPSIQRDDSAPTDATATEPESAAAPITSNAIAATPRSTTTDASEALTTRPDESSSAALVATAPSASSIGTGETTVADVVELSDKAKRLGAKYGHKLKYVQGKEAPRNEVFHFGDKRVAFSTQASPVIAANATFWAAPIAGAGGPVLVERLGVTGKAQHGTAQVINGQKAEVCALAYNPFADNVLATGSADSTIQLWCLPKTVDTFQAPSNPSLTLSGHTKGLRVLQFNPTAADVLCSTSHDLSLRFWDIETGQEKICMEGKLDDITWNMAFSNDGAMLATASRAKIVRVFDPRQPQHALVTMGCGHESNKPQFVAWADSVRLLTVGVNERNETQVSFWDSRSLLEPLRVPVLVEPSASAASTTTPIPLYDASSHLLFLVGTGCRHIWSYEVDPIAATVQANLPFLMTGTGTIGGVSLLPKTMCNVRDVELARLLVATPDVIKRVTFSLPRAQKLKEFFQDDVFGLVPKQEPSVTAARWFAGESGAPVYESLRPGGMALLSEKPKDAAPERPKTLDFQARRREGEEQAREKAAQFAWLSTLAAQPSLHSTHRNVVSTPAPQNVEDDSDDDWDD